MDVFREYFEDIDDPQHRGRVESVLRWVMETFPQLVPRMGWNQPMFTDHGTFIIGFSIAKHHLAIAPEQEAIQHFSEELGKAGYDHSKELIRVNWDAPVDYALLESIISFNIKEKADYKLFWRRR